MLASLLSTGFLGCGNVQQRIDTDIWMHKHQDASIYREVKDDEGNPYQEFLYCSDPSFDLFVSIHEDDLKAWIALLSDITSKLQKKIWSKKKRGN